METSEPYVAPAFWPSLSDTQAAVACHCPLVVFARTRVLYKSQPRLTTRETRGSFLIPTVERTRRRRPPYCFQPVAARARTVRHLGHSPSPTRNRVGQRLSDLRATC